MTTVNVGKGEKHGQATVVVIDDLGNPVEGATVTGDFTGSIIEPGVWGSTDATGTTVIATTGTAKGGVSVEFCVTAIDHTSLMWDENASCASG